MKWTQEQSHQVALITALIAANFFDQINAKIHSGTIDTYDAIAHWALEFHKATYLFDWELAMKAEEIEFATPSNKYKLSGSCWDDFICAYANYKIEHL
jgi:hypothetical protein